MIVPVSSIKYDKLFEDASILLSAFSKLTDGEKIDNISAYYGHMRDFYDIAINEGEHKAFQYIMMPLPGAGEETFLINLNTRDISVPAVYAKTGSIQADQMAELIVFEADRYFDYVDLANANIFVQWQLPDADKTTGASEIQIIDIDSNPGKIRFAWPLNSSVTAHPGLVKFSVRFFMVEDETLVYSLNTADASLMVKAALDPRSQVSYEELGGLFERSIMNSRFSRNGVVPPVRPSFDAPGMDMTVPNENFVRRMTKDEFDNAIVAKLKDNELIMRAQAFAGDAGEISYVWMLDGADMDMDALPEGYVADNAELIKIEDVKEFPYDQGLQARYLDPRQTYYNADGTRYTGDTIPYHEGNYAPDVQALYKKCASLKVTKTASNTVTGRYAVKAINKVGEQTTPKMSTQCVLPAPAPIEFATDVFTLKDNKLKVNIKEDINKPDITYAWHRNINNAEGAIAAAAANTAAPAATGNNITPAPGWYAAHVTAELNGTPATAHTQSAQVVYAKAEITSVKPEKEDTSYNVAAGDTQELKVVVTVPTPTEALSEELYKNLSYEWQYREGVGVGSWRPVSLSKDSDKVAAINGDTLTVIGPPDTGKFTQYSFRCVVTNTLGTDTFTCGQDVTECFIVY